MHTKVDIHCITTYTNIINFYTWYDGSLKQPQEQCQHTQWGDLHFTVYVAVYVACICKSTN